MFFLAMAISIGLAVVVGKATGAWWAGILTYIGSQFVLGWFFRLVLQGGAPSGTVGLAKYPKRHGGKRPPSSDDAFIGAYLGLSREQVREVDDDVYERAKQARRDSPLGPARDVETSPRLRERRFFIAREGMEMVASHSEYFDPEVVSLLHSAWQQPLDSGEDMRKVGLTDDQYSKVVKGLREGRKLVLDEWEKAYRSGMPDKQQELRELETEISLLIDLILVSLEE